MKIIKIIYILLNFHIILILSLYKKNKVCICTIGKKENLYAKEFVDYYKDKGINKIFLYDNNDKNGENFDLVLKEYIDKGYVEIVDIRGLNAPQIQAMEDCRKKNFKKFDWLIFYDMDEFLYLRNYSKINNYLNQKIFEKCQRIQLNWFCHTDNDLLYYDNRTLADRFPLTDKRWNGKKLGGSEGIKSILKGNIDLEITNAHTLNSKLISCDGFGKIRKDIGIITNESDHYYYYIDHYWAKSTEEFVNKLLKGSVALGNDTKHYMKRINMYFNLCNITLEKINYIENKTKLNLSMFRLRLKNEPMIISN